MKTLEIERHKSLSTMVFEQLKQQILAGSISPGTRLMEVELSEKLEVSRTPIREAIRLLEREGLVEVIPRHGAYTSAVSAEEIIGIMEVRRYMDSLAASLAAERGTEEDIEKIAEAADAYREEAEKADFDPNTLIRMDERFHESIASAAHNKALLNMVTELQELVIRFRYIYYSNPDIMAGMLSEHAEILDAIRSGNAKKAGKVAGEHIDGLMNFINAKDRGES